MGAGGVMTHGGWWFKRQTRRFEGLLCPPFSALPALATPTCPDLDDLCRLRFGVSYWWLKACPTLPHPAMPRPAPAARDAAPPEPGRGLLLQRAAVAAGEAAGEAAQAVRSKGRVGGHVGGEGFLLLLLQLPACLQVMMVCCHCCCCLLLLLLPA